MGSGRAQSKQTGAATPLPHASSLAARSGLVYAGKVLRGFAAKPVERRLWGRHSSRLDEV